MFDPVRKITVNIGRQRVGTMALGPDRCCVFEYDPEWIRQGFSISPFFLPLQSGLQKARPIPFEGLFGVFNDSLPDGWGKLLTDRWLRAKGMDPRTLTVLDRLSLVGSHGMGALEYTPCQDIGGESAQEPLERYAEKIEKILRDEETAPLDELMKVAGSSIGARPKVLLTISGKEWLVKFRAGVDPENVGQIEYEHSLLAKKCGIDMPETKLFHGKYFGACRFDRHENKRLHMHSASGMLYASHRLPALDYIGLMKTTLALTRDMREVGKMFRLMVFNVLTGNKDDHAKNFSFIFDEGQWKVSPGYDLLPSEGFGGQHATTVDGQGNPSLADCLQVARKSGFPERKAKDIIDQLHSIIQI